MVKLGIVSTSPDSLPSTLSITSLCLSLYPFFSLDPTSVCFLFHCWHGIYSIRASQHIFILAHPSIGVFNSMHHFEFCKVFSLTQTKQAKWYLMFKKCQECSCSYNIFWHKNKVIFKWTVSLTKLNGLCIMIFRLFLAKILMFTFLPWQLTNLINE